MHTTLTALLGTLGVFLPISAGISYRANAPAAPLRAPAVPSAAQDPEEAKFVAEAVEALDAYATQAFKLGFPGRARQIWLEVIAEYDRDDEVARKALGFVRVGTDWAPAPDFEYPQRDELDAAKAATLQKGWEAVAKKVGQGHRKIAEKSKAAGNQERATYHYGRTLRFLPDDDEAIAANQLVQFEGMHGTELQQHMLQRLRLLRRRVAELKRETFDVQPVADAKHPYLGPVRAPVKAWRGAKFTVWGTWEDDVLKEAALWAERAWAFCEVAFEGVKGMPPADPVTNLVFLKDRADWERTLREQEKSLQLGASLDFLLQHTSSTTVSGPQGRVRLAAPPDREHVMDLAVRYPTQGYTNLRADAMYEGIGHAVVGMFFGRNLTFTVAEENEQGTVSGKKRDSRLQVPDLETWIELAVESAWQKTTVPLDKLALLKASAFPTEGRIKAWSFCYYAMLRDPGLLKLLDRVVSDLGARNPTEVQAKYRELTGGSISVTDLDDGWRRFWTEDTPIQREFRGELPPLTAVSKEAADWLAEINRVRGTIRLGREQLSPIGWSAEYSEACKTHALRLQTQGKAGSRSGAVDADGAAEGSRGLGVRAIVVQGAVPPKKVVPEWIDLPGYRDVILNPGLDRVGLYAERAIMVLDPRGVSDRRHGIHYPMNGQQQVPTDVKVRDLGPDLQQFLAEHGKGDLKVVGYPLTMHFFNGRPATDGGFTCKVRVGKDEVPGLVHVVDRASSRVAAAPGLVVFYPLAPLPRGSKVEVQWHWRLTGGRDEGPRFSFTTK